MSVRDVAVAVELLAGPNGARWPFILDPLGIFVKWLQASLRCSGAKVLQLAQDPVQSITDLAQAAQDGLPVVLTGVGHMLPPPVLPFLDRAYIRTHGKVKLPFAVPVGGTECADVPVASGFMLFLVSTARHTTGLPSAVFALTSPVWVAPSAGMLGAVFLPAVLQLTEPAVAADLGEHATDVATYSAMLRDADAECRVAIADPGALKAARARYVLLDSKCMQAGDLKARGTVIRDAYVPVAELLSRLYLVAYHGGRCGAPEEFVELLGAGAASHLLAEADTGEDPGQRAMAAGAGLTEAVLQHFGSNFVLTSAAAVRCFPDPDPDAVEAPVSDEIFALEGTGSDKQCVQLTVVDLMDVFRRFPGEISDVKMDAGTLGVMRAQLQVPLHSAATTRRTGPRHATPQAAPSHPGPVPSVDH